jgi:putative SOS response-associated peptidase YedK
MTDNTVKELYRRLHAVVQEDAYDRWMAQPNPRFGNKSPNELIRENDVKALWQMLDELESGQVV